VMSDEMRFIWTCGLCGRADFTSEVGALTHKVSVKGKGGKACPEAGRTIHKAVKPEATATAAKSVVVEAAAKSVVVEAAAAKTKSVVVEVLPAASAGQVVVEAAAKTKAKTKAKAKAVKTTTCALCAEVIPTTKLSKHDCQGTTRAAQLAADSVAQAVPEKQLTAHAAAAAKNDRPHGRTAMPDSYVMLTRLEWHAFASTVADFTVDRYEERVKAAAEALIAIREAGLKPELSVDTARALNSSADSPLPVHETATAEAVKVSQDDGYGHI